MESITLNQPYQRKAVPNGILAMILILTTEVMLFAGLISAYIVNRAGAMVWPPADQPRLPIEVTGINTCILLLSGVILYLFTRRAKNLTAPGNSINLLLVAMIFGATFLIVQGTEWARLLGYGLTTHSSIYGAFFYTIIGLHGVHVLVGLTILTYLFFKVKSAPSLDTLRSTIISCSLYWYFVVGIWPVLYRLVYFN
jgi:cytochrome c oxidase subunit III